MEKTKLAPCKLCGGDAFIAKVEKNDPPCHYNDWVVGCRDCGCRFTYAADGYYGREYISEEEVREKWNKLHGGA